MPTGFIRSVIDLLYRHIRLRHALTISLKLGADLPTFRTPKLSLISQSKDWPKIDRPSYGSNGRRAQLAWILSLLSKAEQKGSLALT